MASQHTMESATRSTDDDRSRAEEIDGFLARYGKNFVEAPVKDLRHIISIFLMEVYADKFGQYSRKVRGIWSKAPDDWPARVPFVDPNNKIKGEATKNCKPKKESCVEMLIFLNLKLQEKRSGKKSQPTKVETGGDLMFSSLLHSTAAGDNASLFGEQNDFSNDLSSTNTDDYSSSNSEWMSDQLSGKMFTLYDAVSADVTAGAPTTNEVFDIPNFFPEYDFMACGSVTNFISTENSVNDVSGNPGIVFSENNCVNQSTCSTFGTQQPTEDGALPINYNQPCDDMFSGASILQPAGINNTWWQQQPSDATAPAQDCSMVYAFLENGKRVELVMSNNALVAQPLACHMSYAQQPVEHEFMVKQQMEQMIDMQPDNGFASQEHVQMECRQAVQPVEDAEDEFPESDPLVESINRILIKLAYISKFPEKFPLDRGASEIIKARCDQLKSDASITDGNDESLPLVDMAHNLEAAVDILIKKKQIPNELMSKLRNPPCTVGVQKTVLPLADLAPGPAVIFKEATSMKDAVSNPAELNIKTRQKTEIVAGSISEHVELRPVATAGNQSSTVHDEEKMDLGWLDSEKASEKDATLYDLQLTLLSNNLHLNDGIMLQTDRDFVDELLGLGINLHNTDDNNHKHVQETTTTDKLDIDNVNFRPAGTNVVDLSKASSRCHPYSKPTMSNYLFTCSTSQPVFTQAATMNSQTMSGNIGRNISVAISQMPLFGTSLVVQDEQPSKREYVDLHEIHEDDNRRDLDVHSDGPDSGSLGYPSYADLPAKSPSAEISMSFANVSLADRNRQWMRDSVCAPKRKLDTDREEMDRRAKVKEQLDQAVQSSSAPIPAMVLCANLDDPHFSSNYRKRSKK